MVEHGTQALLVQADHAVQKGLEMPVQPALGGFRFTLHQTRTDHRSNAQRDEGRDNNGKGQCQGKFAEHMADGPIDEQHRNKGRHQRQRDREHRKPDLLRAFARGLQARQSLFQLGMDVFNHHNRIIDHKAHCNGDRQE